MPESKITINIREAGEDINVVDLQGFLDTATIPTVEEVLKRLLKENKYKIIINFEKLEYISSSGIGLLMSIFSEIRENKGDLKLVNVNQKVQKVFKLLGFSELMTVFEKEEDAIKDFQKPHLEEKPAVEFPVKVECCGCGLGYTIPKVGIYRCRKCNEVFFVEPQGKVLSIKKGNVVPQLTKKVEFKVPADVNYLQHLRKFITASAAEEGFEEEKVHQIEIAFDEAITNVIEHAYNFDATKSITVSLIYDEEKMSITMLDEGKSFQPEELPIPDIKEHIAERKSGGFGRYLIHTLMDDVQYVKRSDSINELRMVKYFKGKKKEEMVG